MSLMYAFRIVPISSMVVPSGLDIIPCCMEPTSFLDNGAADSLIREDFAIEIGMTGTNRLMNFETFHGSDPLLPSRTVEFELYAPNDETIRFDVTASTTPVLEVVSRRWKVPPSLTDLADLDGVSYPDVDQGEVTILIGYDIFEAHVQKEIRRPTAGVQGPFAVRFPLGWSPCGPLFEVNQRSRAIFCISRDDQPRTSPKSSCLQPARSKKASTWTISWISSIPL